MADLDQALKTQLANIEKRTGKSLAELHAWIRATGLSKHGEIRDRLKTDLGMGHGDANTLVTIHLREAAAAEGTGAAATADAAVDEIYSGAKAALRPIHDRVMAIAQSFGEFEVAPKKGYVSLRRKKQFAMVGPATKTQVEVGLNAKDLAGSARLAAIPPGGMCQYKVRLSAPQEADAELEGWLRRAFDAAG